MSLAKLHSLQMVLRMEVSYLSTREIQMIKFSRLNFFFLGGLNFQEAVGRTQA